MRKSTLFLFLIFLTLAGQAQAYTTPVSQCGWPSGATIQYSQCNINTSANCAVLEVEYTAVGVTEQVGLSKSCYAYTATLTGGNAYRFCFKNITPEPDVENCWTVESFATSVDALISSRTKPADTQAAVTTVGTVTGGALEATLTAMKGATFNGSTDSLEAIRDRGDAAWMTGAGLTGDYQITTTVYVTATTTPIPDYALSVYDSSNTVFQGKTLTSAGGISVLNLDSGTYKVRGRKSGYTAANPTETLVVSADGTATYYAAAYVIPAPASADVCRVYEWIKAQDGETIPATVKATAQIVSLPYSYQGSLMAGNAVNGTYDATTGLLYWDIVKGAKVQFDLPIYGWNKQKIIPTDATKRLSTLE